MSVIAVQISSDSTGWFFMGLFKQASKEQRIHKGPSPPGVGVGVEGWGGGAGLCVTGRFPSQRDSNAEIVLIPHRHHVYVQQGMHIDYFAVCHCDIIISCEYMTYIHPYTSELFHSCHWGKRMTQC